MIKYTTAGALLIGERIVINNFEAEVTDVRYSRSGDVVSISLDVKGMGPNFVIVPDNTEFEIVSE
jgi:hypothetical protein